MRAPDILHGFATVGTNLKNSWQTDIRSVLCKHSNTGENNKFAYLTHECRAEGINHDQIFNDRFYEYVAVKGWDCNYNIRSGAQCYGIGVNQLFDVYEISDIEIDTQCPDVQVTEYTFDEVLYICQKGIGHEFFLKINYRFDDEEWVVYTPARYINFPNGEMNNDCYLQPISGHTLFYNGEKFVVSYVATHIRKQSCHIEFIVREQNGFLELKQKTSKLYRLLWPIKKIINTIFQTDEFCKIYKVTGSVTFFRYE